jgi:hypothetical protein
MSRSAFRGSLLVLEGDEDVRFWKSRIANHSVCQIIQAGSKPTVIGAVVKADGLNEQGILGIIDDDCDSCRGLSMPSVNLIRTETRDIETLMLSTSAFDSVLYELGDETKIAALEQSEGRNIRDAFISRALIFGQLRYLNALNSWNVSFDRISPYKFAQPLSWSFDKVAILQEISAQICGLTAQDLEESLAALELTNPWSVLHGKDSLNVLAIGLRGLIGNRQYPASQLSQMLRLAFHGVLFRSTSLYLNIKAWESTNSTYRILTE